MMTPIERVSIKSKALAVLGLNSTAVSQEDIRLAYRARVRENHPDRCNGSSDAFLRITDAFKFLSGDSDEFNPRPTAAETSTPEDDSRVVSRRPRPTMDFTPKSRTRSQTLSRPVSKPAMQETKTAFSTDILTACRDALGSEGGFLATQQQRVGRKLAFSVPVKLLNSVNRLAVPTGDFLERGEMKPVVLTIDAVDIVGGSYLVPSDVVEAKFPGARHVEIRFMADA